MKIKLLRENIDYLGQGIWREDALDVDTDQKLTVKYIRRIYKQAPWMELEFVDVREAGY